MCRAWLPFRCGFRFYDLNGLLNRWFCRYLIRRIAVIPCCFSICHARRHRYQYRTDRYEYNTKETTSQFHNRQRIVMGMSVFLPLIRNEHDGCLATGTRPVRDHFLIRAGRTPGRIGLFRTIGQRRTHGSILTGTDLWPWILTDDDIEFARFYITLLWLTILGLGRHGAGCSYHGQAKQCYICSVRVHHHNRKSCRSSGSGRLYYLRQPLASSEKKAPRCGALLASAKAGVITSYRPCHPYRPYQVQQEPLP